MKKKPLCVTESSTKMDAAYISLFKYIRTDMILNKTIIQVTSLTAEPEVIREVGEISESMKKIFLRTLQTELKDSVHIFISVY